LWIIASATHRIPAAGHVNLRLAAAKEFTIILGDRVDNVREADTEPKNSVIIGFRMSRLIES
jgi:hypothetical protein